MRPARANAVSISLAAGTISSTSPMRNASLASMISP